MAIKVSRFSVYWSQQDLAMIQPLRELQLTFSSFNVFLELLLGSRMSLVSFAAAMAMKTFLQMIACIHNGLWVRF